jgi:hypothetical protein
MMSNRTIQMLEVGTLWGGVGAFVLVLIGTVALILSS